MFSPPTPSKTAFFRGKTTSFKQKFTFSGRDVFVSGNDELYFLLGFSLSLYVKVSFHFDGYNNTTLKNENRMRGKYFSI